MDRVHISLRDKTFSETEIRENLYLHQHRQGYVGRTRKQAPEPTNDRKRIGDRG